MKKTDRYKTIQLFVFLVISLISMVTVIFRHGSGQVASLLLWVTLAISFFFIFLDFSLFTQQQKSYEEMIKTMGSDPVSKVANRYSIDAILDKYQGHTLPEKFVCIAFEITNLKEINEAKGRQAGNEILVRFSNALELASLDRFFVGRNGGSRFIAMAEGLSTDDVDDFLRRILQKVEQFNSRNNDLEIRYTIAWAFHEQEDPSGDIVHLIALANRRIDYNSQIHTISKEGTCHEE